MDFICGKRLKAIMESIINKLEEKNELMIFCVFVKCRRHLSECRKARTFYAVLGDAAG